MRRLRSGTWPSINRPSQAYGERFVELKHGIGIELRQTEPLTTLVMFGRAYRMSLGINQRPPPKLMLGLV